MHTFLSLDMNLIPDETKINVPTFWGGLFSNDGSRMLIDGYNENGDLVHPKATMLKWLQWSENPETVINTLLSNAIEYTAEQYKEETKNPESIWYVEFEE